MPRKLTQDEFIEKVKKIYGDHFDLSRIKYKNCDIKIEVGCPLHGFFFISPHSFLRGHNCPHCKKGTISKEEFLKEAKKIHPEYDYSKVVYINKMKKVEIICPKHGSFFMSPKDLLRGRGCPDCAGKNMTTEKFINIAKKIHPEYDYSKTIYTGKRNNIIVTCPIHGDFIQQADNHIRLKCGCPKCAMPKGEREIEKFLIKNNIVFETQKRFKGCKNKQLLSFDFYIPSKKLTIEFQGIQHYEPVGFFGGEKGFNKQIKVDQIKRDYCRNNNIKEIEISYKDFNKIEKILTESIKK